MGEHVEGASVTRRTVWSKSSAVASAVAVAVLAVCANSLSASAAHRSARVISVTMSISANAPTKPISSLIYGLNLSASDPATAHIVSETNAGLLRLGGNRFTAYNWENNDSNAGSDWYFHNDDYLDSSTAPADAVLPTVRLSVKDHLGVIITVPIVDYVAANRCGCDVENDANYLQNDFNVNKANTSGALPSTPDLTDHTVYEDQFVAYLKKQAPSANMIFALDNEPDLWSSTHAEIHPQALSYSELLSRDVSFATMIKRVWPQAQVIGPVNYGWEGMVSLQGAPDSSAKGDFLTWWLQQIRAANAAAHHTLVDQVDVHWYPEATGAGVRITGTSTAPAVVAAREQAPRSLWDPNYLENSWITTDTGSGPLHLITRIQAKIAANDPGAGLDISEWNYGAGQSISGAIATADVLGIFGRYGVHAAANWPLNSDESFTDAAFSLYRNYDGHGSHFGNLEQRANTSSSTLTSIYASSSSSAPSSESVVVINKSTSNIRITLNVSSKYQYHYALGYRLSGASRAISSLGRTDATTVNHFTVQLPAQSVEMLTLH
jgi:hypothetical protein